VTGIQGARQPKRKTEVEKRVEKMSVEQAKAEYEAQAELYFNCGISDRRLVNALAWKLIEALGMEEYMALVERLI
jgi:hypothetical protein